MSGKVFEPWELNAAKASIREWDGQPVPDDPEERRRFFAARKRMMEGYRAKFGEAIDR